MESSTVQCITCRKLCLREKVFRLLQKPQYSEFFTIYEMLMFCLRIPQMEFSINESDRICLMCLKELRFCVKFITKCIKSFKRNRDQKINDFKKVEITATIINQEQEEHMDTQSCTENLIHVIETTSLFPKSSVVQNYGEPTENGDCVPYSKEVNIQDGQQSQTHLEQILAQDKSEENISIKYEPVDDELGTGGAHNIQKEEIVQDGKNEINQHAETRTKDYKYINKKTVRNYKITRCKFCDKDVGNFSRHILRYHKKEMEIEELLKYPKKSKARRQAMCLLRNYTHFELFVKAGTPRPNRITTALANDQYYPCLYCKGLYSRKYLSRHSKSCFVRGQTANTTLMRECHVADSQTMLAFAMDSTNVISQLNVTEQVFRLMKPDKISFEAKKDLLVAYIGESYLKNHKHDKAGSKICSNRLRELSRLLITFRKITENKNISLKDILDPKHYETTITAVRQIAGYSHETNTFRAPNTALHFGRMLKFACDVLAQLILSKSKGFICKTPEESESWLQCIKSFRDLIVTRWINDFTPLASEVDIINKQSNKQWIELLTSNVKHFREKVILIAQRCKNTLINNNTDEEAYHLLSHCALSLLVLFNRKKIEYIQSLKIKDYINTSSANVVENVPTIIERKLTTQCTRISISANEKRKVVILLPPFLQEFTDTLVKCREKHILTDNEFVFAVPSSNVTWINGDISINMLCKKLNIQSIRTRKLRKRISIVMQLLSLSQDEAKDFFNFIRNAGQTDIELNGLPLDINQIAKVSHLLLVMEKNKIPLKYKRKALSKIGLDSAAEHPKENCDTDHACIETNSHSEESHEASPLISDSGLQDIQRENNCSKKLIDDSIERQTDVVFKTSSKLKWNDTEIAALKNEFKSYIENKQYPSGEKIKNFIEKTKSPRTVLHVRSKIQHLLKNNI